MLPDIGPSLEDAVDAFLSLRAGESVACGRGFLALGAHGLLCVFPAPHGAAAEAADRLMRLQLREGGELEAVQVGINAAGRVFVACKPERLDPLDADWLRRALPPMLRMAFGAGAADDA